MEPLYIMQKWCGLHSTTIFPEGWICREAPIAWLPRSPDLTSMNLFFGDYVKDIVYQGKIQSFDHLRQRITVTVEAISPDMFARVWNEVGLSVWRVYKAVLLLSFIKRQKNNFRFCTFVCIKLSLQNWLSLYRYLQNETTSLGTS